MPTAMPSLSPRTTLFLLLSLAAVILGGGLRLARTSESVRIDRSREALRGFAEDAQRELQRLEDLYESHLARLARTLPNDAFGIRREADRIGGVRQVSLLHRGSAVGVPDNHVQMMSAPNERLPLPSFTAPVSGAVRAVLLLDADKFFDPEIRNGWIEEPGKPLMYWLRRSSNEIAVLVIDSASVESSVSRWLEKWAPRGFAPILAAGGPDQFRTRDAVPLVTAGDQPGSRPDLLLPLRSRLGSWDLASWDRREKLIRYDPATLTASASVSILVAFLGVLVFGQQKRTSALAAQRVSFVNRVSHELRSPLTNILLNIDLATDAIEDAPNDAIGRLALVQEEAQRLGRLIDNVLTFSRQEQGRLLPNSKACMPAVVIGSVVEQFTASFNRRALTVNRSGNANVSCLLDSDALAQILGNLLSNVEKYVPGGKIQIAESLEDGILTITVSDEGPGIPAAAAERIFHPFERLGTRVNEGSSGTGLGLAIARDLAACMGGSLRLVPLGCGASFELRIPAPPCVPSPPPHENTFRR